MRSGGTTVDLCLCKGYELGDVIATLQILYRHTIHVKTDPELTRANELKTLISDPGRLKALLPELPAFDLLDIFQWMVSESGGNAPANPTSVEVEFSR